jgi:hypothetical protein
VHRQIAHPTTDAATAKPATFARESDQRGVSAVATFEAKASSLEEPTVEILLEFTHDKKG